MNRSTTFAASVALVFALASVLVHAQSSTTDHLKGRALTLRTCVERGINDAVLLKNFVDVTTVENGGPLRLPASRVVYWFQKPADLKERVGHMVEISASVTEA